MSWIKIQNGLVTNKKTARLAGQMKWKKLEAVGFMVSFWIWALENCEDGQLKDISDNEIAFSVGLDTAPGILEALKIAGFVDGKPLRIHDWPEYQHEFLRAKYRREPDKHQRIIDLYRYNTSTNTDRQIGRKEDRKKDSKIETTYSVEFLEFWNVYPYKTAKDKAWTAWQKLTPPLTDCIKTLAWQIKTDGWTKENGKYIPMPVTWLNGGRWKDEPVRASVSGGAAPIPGKYDGIGEKA